MSPTNLDRHPSIVVNGAMGLIIIFVVHVFCSLLHGQDRKPLSGSTPGVCGQNKGTHLIHALLHQQSPPPRRHKSFEYFFKVLGHHFERPLNSLVLALIQHINQVINRLCRILKVLPVLQQLISLLCKVGVLLKGLLVDMSKFFEGVLYF